MDVCFGKLKNSHSAVISNRFRLLQEFTTPWYILQCSCGKKRACYCNWNSNNRAEVYSRDCLCKLSCVITQSGIIILRIIPIKTKLGSGK